MSSGTLSATFVLIAAFVAQLSPVSQPSDDMQVLLVGDESGTARESLLQDILNQLHTRYEQEGYDVTLISEREIDKWISRQQPRLSKADLRFKAAAFGRASGAEFVDILRIDDPRKNRRPGETMEIRGCDGVLRDPVEAELFGIDLRTCVCSGGFAHLGEADGILDHLPDPWFLCHFSQPADASTYPSGWFAIPPFDLGRGYSDAEASLVKRMFGVRLDGCSIAYAGPHSVGRYYGLQEGDEILEIDGTPVTTRTLVSRLSTCDPEAVRFTLKRGSGRVQIMVRPVGLSKQALVPFQVIGKNIVGLAATASVKEERKRWLESLGPERKIIVLQFRPGRVGSTDPVTLTAELLNEKLKSRGLRWVLVSSEEDSAKWQRTVAEDLTGAVKVRDTSLARELMVESWPGVFVLDREGSVLYRDLGSPEDLAGVVAYQLQHPSEP